ncbi:MAG: PIG-L family deacetylase [Ilumatobacteraceae bacterium]
MSEPLVLLSVHAHPDDEASKGAPTVARYHAEGVRTVLVCCTGGEEGDLQNPSLREPGQPFHGLTPEQEKAMLAELRPSELAASAAAIGFDETIMLGYRDSGMAESPSNENPESFHQADLDEAVGRLVEIIRHERPQVILTYGDDQSIYPHPDHLRVHDISVPAFDRAGDPDWYPEAGTPFQPSKLYYTTWSHVPDGRSARGAAATARRLAVRREVARPPEPGRPHHDPARRAPDARRTHRRAAGTCDAGGPHRGVLVRALRRRARRRVPVRGLDPRPLACR